MATVFLAVTNLVALLLTRERERQYSNDVIPFSDDVTMMSPSCTIILLATPKMIELTGDLDVTFLNSWDLQMRQKIYYYAIKDILKTSKGAKDIYIYISDLYDYVVYFFGRCGSGMSWDKFCCQFVHVHHSHVS